MLPFWKNVALKSYQLLLKRATLNNCKLGILVDIRLTSYNFINMAKKLMWFGNFLSLMNYWINFQVWFAIILLILLSLSVESVRENDYTIKQLQIRYMVDICLTGNVVIFEFLWICWSWNDHIEIREVGISNKNYLGICWSWRRAITIPVQIGTVLIWRFDAQFMFWSMIKLA